MTLGEIAEGTPAAEAVAALVASAGPDARAALAALRAERIPPAAAASLAEAAVPALAEDPEWRDAVTADLARAERIARAVASVDRTLAGVTHALPGASLGPLWSSDVDVLVAPDEMDAAAAALERSGFIGLDRLLHRLGRRGSGRRFAAVEGGEVLAAVELDAADPALLARAAANRLSHEDSVERRLRKIATERRASLRSRLELEALGGERQRSPARWAAARVAGVRRESGRRLRPRRLRVAFSGVDGSGKSTQAGMLVDNLRRLEIPAVSVWNRLGWGGSAMLTRAASLGQRLLPAGSHSAQRARATGETSSSSRTPLTRRGPVGWAWAMAVTLDYLVRPMRPVRRARSSVVVFDRGLPDALIGLEEDFGGALRLTAQRRLIERLGQRPDLVVHLRLTGAQAKARKDDLFTADVLETHSRRYGEHLAGRPNVLTLDATRPAGELGLEVLRAVAQAQ